MADVIPVRVFTVVNWCRQRVHGITTSEEQSRQWVRELLAQHPGAELVATQTVDVVYVPADGPRRPCPACSGPSRETVGVARQTERPDAAVATPTVTGLPKCPCCGKRATLGRYDVCVPCAAGLGWDPECVACLDDQAGRTSEAAHVQTCSAWCR